METLSLRHSGLVGVRVQLFSFGTQLGLFWRGGWESAQWKDWRVMRERKRGLSAKRKMEVDLRILAKFRCCFSFAIDCGSGVVDFESSRADSQSGAVSALFLRADLANFFP